MVLLTSTAPRMVLGRAIDILDVAPDQGMSRGFARVDLGDPVFFDHPLDHVPGMLLAVAVLELAEQCSMLEPDNITFRLTFTKFCELGAAVEVTAVREAGGTSRINVIQSGRSIAAGLLGWGDHPLGMKVIFVGLTADVPSAVPVGHMSRALSWQITPPEQTSKPTIDVYAVGDRARKVGSILLAGRCVDGDEYAQLRAR